MPFHLWELICSLPFAIEDQCNWDTALVAPGQNARLGVVSGGSRVSDFLKLCFPLHYLLM